jgi:glycosyltransferase involved in cell wall biosynthesis
VKILFCKNSFAGPISGADEIAVTYAVELKAAGHSTGMLLVHPPASDDPLAERLRTAGVTLTTLASPAFSASLAAARKLAIRAMRACSPASQLILTNSRKVVFDLLQRYHESCCEFLKHNRPDLIHVLTPDPGAVMFIHAAHSLGIPVVYQEVGIPFHPPGFEEVYERFALVLPLCAGVAVLSPRLAQEISRVLPQLDPAYVLPLMSPCAGNGSPNGSPNGSTPANPALKKVRFGFAARLEHLKGPLQLVRAFGVVHETHPEVELKIAGSGSQRQEIILALNQLGLAKKCHLSGVYTSVKQRNDFMQDIDVFVLPSLTEGTPNAIIEAMAHAKPIIATAVGGIPDVVCEEVGILVSPNDTEALSAAMARLAGDANLRGRMGLAAREQYEKLFTPRVVLPLLTHFYERVLSGAKASSNGSNGHGQLQSVMHEASHPWSSFEVSRCEEEIGPR